MIRTILMTFLLGFIFSSCEYFAKAPQEDVIARVNDKYLYYSDIRDLVPENTTPEDSVLIINNYINQWATKELLIDRALVNLSKEELDNFDRLVQEYKNDLLTDAYKNAIISRQLDSLVTDKQFEEYYEETKGNYKLNEVLLKLRYIHLPVNYEGIEDVKTKFQRFKKEDMEALHLQTYNYVSSNLNDSVWIKKSSLLNVLPAVRTAGDDILKSGAFTQLKDSLGIYLIKIEGRLNINDDAPLSYIKPTLKQIIINKRKLELINRFESDITRDAIRHNNFQIYTYE